MVPLASLCGPSALPTIPLAQALRGYAASRCFSSGPSVWEEAWKLHLAVSHAMTQQPCLMTQIRHTCTPPPFLGRRRPSWLCGGAKLLVGTTTWALQVGAPVCQDSRAGCCEPLPRCLSQIPSGQGPQIPHGGRPEWVLPRSDPRLSFRTGGNVDLARPLSMALRGPGGQRMRSARSCFSYAPNAVCLGLCGAGGPSALVF